MASPNTLPRQASDPEKDIALFINDFDQEFADALDKLANTLGRPLRGIILVDSNVKALGRNTPDRNNIFEQIVCDFSDPEALRATITKIERNILFVTCSAERNQPYLKRVLPHVPYLFGPTESSIEWATHKSKMRAVLGGYNPALVPNNITVTGASSDEIDAVVAKLSFPMIVKPTGLAASILVTRVHNETELRETVERSFALIEAIYERDRGRGNPSLIIEEFIEGDMYTVDVYVNETGHVWSLPLLRARTAYAIGLEGFYTYRTDSYHELTPKEIEAGQDAAEQAVHALCLRSCVAHIELYHTTDGWKIIELGPRAGGQRQDIYALAYGIDHAYNEFRIKVGLPPELNAEPVAHIQTLNFYAEEEGVITALEGFEEARAHPSIYYLKLYAQPGMMALSSSNGGKLIADGIAYHKDHEQLEKDAAAVRKMIKITTKKTKAKTTKPKNS